MDEELRDEMRTEMRKKMEEEVGNRRQVFQKTDRTVRVAPETQDRDSVLTELLRETKETNKLLRELLESFNKIAC
jgi:hypothetical protein